MLPGSWPRAVGEVWWLAGRCWSLWSRNQGGSRATRRQEMDHRLGRKQASDAFQQSPPSRPAHAERVRELAQERRLGRPMPPRAARKGQLGGADAPARHQHGRSRGCGGGLFVRPASLLVSSCPRRQCPLPLVQRARSRRSQLVHAPSQAPIAIASPWPLRACDPGPS